MATIEKKMPVNIALRVNLCLGITATAFFIICLRLWYLQILKGDYFRGLSENNRISTVFIPPPRGLILDRKGRVLVKNRPSFNIDLVTEDSEDPKKTLTRLGEILDKRPAELINNLKFQRKRHRFEPKLILKDITRDMVAKVAARRHELPGVVISVIPARDYVHKDFAAHLLGYIREINPSQLESPKYVGSALGDLVGQYGVESIWERDLKGERGKLDVVVDATGTRRGELALKPERAGHNVTLTIDFDVQRAADEALSGKKGAIIAMDPNTGELLALSSSPRFDPNMFTGEVSRNEWKELVSGKNRALNNRAAQGGFPPGSVFKIFMAVAGLTEGVIRPAEEIDCPGYYYLGRTFRCHKAGGHGLVNLESAMAQSCDVYFYTIGQRLGIDRIHKYATRFGLGSITGLALAEEHPGIVPSEEWKRTHFKREEDKKWYPGETPSVAIGQGALVVTPLQITRAVSAVVNGGRLLKPHLVRSVVSEDGTFRDEDFKPEVQGNLDVDGKVLKRVRDSLVAVVNDERGTGRRAQVEKSLNIVVGGKTGTAQVGSLDLRLKGEHFEDHAWFVGFAPAEKTEIVVTALVENGGHGGVAAAPLVKQVMEAYFFAKNPLVDQPALLERGEGQKP